MYDIADFRVGQRVQPQPDTEPMTTEPTADEIAIASLRAQRDRLIKTSLTRRYDDRPVAMTFDPTGQRLYIVTAHGVLHRYDPDDSRPIPGTPARDLFDQIAAVNRALATLGVDDD